MKKLLLLLLLFSLIISIRKDLTVGTNLATDAKKPDTAAYQTTAAERVQPVLMRAESGDTLLSIAKKLNKQDTRVTIENVTMYFEKWNPGADPLQLQPETAYYFPYYPQK